MSAVVVIDPALEFVAGACVWAEGLSAEAGGLYSS